MLKKFQKYPLCPFVVGGVSGVNLAIPIIIETNLL